MGCAFAKVAKEEEDIYDMSPIQNHPVIFVNGVPGAGNQTVAQTVANISGYCMIRPGELIRAEAGRDTVRGRLVADKLRALEDIPEQITVDLIKEAMLQQKEEKGFILVGFPKNPKMSDLFSKQVKWPEKIVALEVDKEIAATRLQTKLSELGRPESEVNSARQIIRDAAHKVKRIHKRYGRHVVTLNSNDNTSNLSSTLREILSETMEKHSRKDSASEAKIAAPLSAPAMSSPAPLVESNENVTEAEIQDVPLN